MIYIYALVYDLAWLAAIVFLIIKDHPWWAAAVFFLAHISIRSHDEDKK